MSLQPATYDEAKKSFKPLQRSQIRSVSQKQESRIKTLPAGRIKRGGILRKTAKKRKRLTDSKLKKKIWKEFSIHVRSSAADEQGVVQCVTCPARHVWNSGQIQAGHWIHNRLDFDERNVHPQCVPCNYHWNTKVSISYSIFMAKTYGIEVMEELQLLANTQGNRYPRAELERLLNHYKELNRANPLVSSIGNTL